MSHCFGQASYALMYDYYDAERELRRFNSSKDPLPDDEWRATYFLLLGRALAAKDAVDHHPPWVITPNQELDGATIRIVAGFSRAARNSNRVDIPDEVMAWAHECLSDIISHELRRISFDRKLAAEHRTPTQHRPGLLFDPGVYRAVDTAAQQKMGGVEECRATVENMGRYGELQDYGYEVIHLYQLELEKRRKDRSIFRWFHRWRERRKG